MVVDTILFGDCRETLKEFDGKARTCVTSPPYYGLRDYGGEESQIGQEQTPEEYIQNLVEVFRSVRDVLTDDGTLWVNIGDSYLRIGIFTKIWYHVFPDSFTLWCDFKQSTKALSQMNVLSFHNLCTLPM